VEEATQATTGKRKVKRGWFKGTNTKTIEEGDRSKEIGTVFVALNL
jgi:hypothetical protein